jgi:stringent starvation protein B
LPPKKDVALALLERSSVYVHLDPRHVTAVVPAWFKKQPQLVLQVGMNMPVPIPDLHVDDDGLSCTLSFNRSPFFCVVPWASVFAMVGDDGRGMVWPEDVPAEIARQAQVHGIDGGAQQKEASKTPAAARAPTPTKPKKPRKRPPLASVNDRGAAPPSKAIKPSRSARPERSRAPEAGASPPVRPVAPVERPKRKQLPPYLRVVK